MAIKWWVEQYEPQIPNPAANGEVAIPFLSTHSHSRPQSPRRGLGPSVDRVPTTHMNAHAGTSSLERRRLANTSSSASTPFKPGSGTFCLQSALRPVCQGSPHSSQGSLLPQCQSPRLLLPAPPSAHQLNCHSPLAWRQVQTGRNLKEARNSGEMRLLLKPLFCFLSNWSENG